MQTFTTQITVNVVERFKGKQLSGICESRSGVYTQSKHMLLFIKIYTKLYAKTYSCKDNIGVI